MADLQMWGNILLLIGGLILAIPPVMGFLGGMVGGYIPILVGIICVILALVLLFKK